MLIFWWPRWLAGRCYVVYSVGVDIVVATPGRLEDLMICMYCLGVDIVVARPGRLEDPIN